MGEIIWGDGGPGVAGSAIVIDGSTDPAAAVASADPSFAQVEIAVGEGGPAIGGAAEVS